MEAMAVNGIDTAVEKCSVPYCNTEGTVGKELVVVQKQDPLRGTKRQVRCSPCNSAQARVKRVCKMDPDAKAKYIDLTTDGKEKFMIKMIEENLVGDKLRQVLTETVSWCRHQRSMQHQESNGNFYTEKQIRGDKELETDEAEAILLSLNTMVCAVTGKTLYWKPKYSMGLSKSEELSDMRKRELESEEKMKQTKKNKAKREPAEPGVDDQEEIDIPPAQKARLEACVPKIEEIAFDLARELASAKDPERKDLIAQAVITNGDTTNQAIEETIARVKNVLNTMKTKKGEIAELFASIKTESSDAKKIKKKISDDLKYAAEAAGA